jgi:MerR family transcriptional regulator, thiopeptide resistance regulator
MRRPWAFGPDRNGRREFFSKKPLDPDAASGLIFQCMEKGRTVRELARVAGVSVRTLHHYDDIGLLKPDRRTESGYRLYGPAELLRLQQILFFRELEFPLADIARILDEPGFDPTRALRGHRKALEEKLGRLDRLLKTLDDTLKQYEGGPMLTDEELYRGFTPEKITAVKKEARELYGENIVEQSERKVKAMNREKWQAINRDVDAACREMAALMAAGSDPGESEVQSLVALHYAWILNFWTPDAESYAGLGRLYREHPEFRAFYEKYAPGFADYLGRAMDRYCEGFPGG